MGMWRYARKTEVQVKEAVPAPAEGLDTERVKAAVAVAGSAVKTPKSAGPAAPVGSDKVAEQEKGEQIVVECIGPNPLFRSGKRLLIAADGAESRERAIHLILAGANGDHVLVFCWIELPRLAPGRA